MKTSVETMKILPQLLFARNAELWEILRKMPNSLLLA